MKDKRKIILEIPKGFLAYNFWSTDKDIEKRVIKKLKEKNKE